MKDDDKTKEQLVMERSGLRRPIEDLRKTGCDIVGSGPAEEALKAQERKFRAIFDQSCQLMWLLTVDGRVIEANRNALQFAGIEESEVTGKPFRETAWWKHSNEAQEMLRAAVTEVSAGGFARFEATHPTADGDLRHVDFSLRPIMDEAGGVSFLIAEGRDITDRKRAEDRLRQSEQEKTILNRIADVCLTIPDEKVYEEALAVIVKALGCRFGVFGYIGEGADLVIPSMTKEIWSDCRVEGKSISFPRHLWGESLWGRAIREKKSFCSDGPFQIPEGHLPIYNFLTVPVVFADKTIGLTSAANKEGGFSEQDRAVLERIACNIAPILNTRLERDRQERERKQAEAALKESQQQLEDIIDFLPDATLVIDRGGKVIAWNRAIEEMTGVKSADMVGKGNYEYAIPFYGERRPILIDLVLNPTEEVEGTYVALERKGGVLSGEAYMPALKGGGTYLFGNASALYDSRGKVVGAIESIRDITERRLMEEAVGSAEKKYRDIFENSVTGKYQVDVDGRLFNANSAIAHLHGYDSPEEFLQAVSNVRQLFVNRERRAEMLRLIDEQGLVKDFEVELSKKDKSVVWASLTIRAVRGDDGKVAYLDGTAVDITRSKHLKAQLEQAQKMESVGRLAGGVAHDFNNMLGVITGRAELALLQDVSPQVRTNLEEILQAAKRSADLTRQLLAFARKQIASPKILNLNDTISGMFKMLRRLIREDIDLSWIPAMNLWEVKIDPSQVDQILANLVVNAGDAITGPGNITVRTENVVIDDSWRAERPELITGDYVLVTVSDTGAGMSEEVCEKVFEPFFTTKELGKGTGLGLSTVYGIVKQNEGFIYVESRPGEGATFRIYLPRFEAEAVQAPPKEAEVEVRRGAETILLVEDDEAVLNLSRMLLESLGYKVLLAQTWLPAIQLALEHKKDLRLLMTDVVMPGMNGRELMEKLRSFLPDLKCLFMSGYTADVIAHRGVLDEGVNFIQKPFNMAELAEKVREVLDAEEGWGERR